MPGSFFHSLVVDATRDSLIRRGCALRGSLFHHLVLDATRGSLIESGCGRASVFLEGNGTGLDDDTPELGVIKICDNRLFHSLVCLAASRFASVCFTLLLVLRNFACSCSSSLRSALFPSTFSVLLLFGLFRRVVLHFASFFFAFWFVLVCSTFSIMFCVIPFCFLVLHSALLGFI